ncbi:MAG: MFS transporter, partial [Thermogemmata sp.]|nr:MFS transporter [Thermogemmata sp.]
AAPLELSPLVRTLVLIAAAIGFLFDTYELLMFPVIGAQALSELLGVEQNATEVRLWAGRMLWMAALSGGLFGLYGGVLVDRFGRKTIMIASILLYSLSPVAAATSTALWQFVLFRCTTFIGVCVELVAAVTWLAELFTDRRQRERAIGWTLAFASLGGILVTEVFNAIVAALHAYPAGWSLLTDVGIAPTPWRYTLLTGLVPGVLILLLMPFVPESRQWQARKQAGTLQRPRLRELFAPQLRQATLVTTILSACSYGAAFGALQLGPSVMAAGLPDVQRARQESATQTQQLSELIKNYSDNTPERQELEQRLNSVRTAVPRLIDEKRGQMQRWQELGGLTGRILFALLVVYVASQLLIRLFLIPGLILFPLTYLVLYHGDFTLFCAALFLCGLVTIAQFSYVSEYLPKVFPLHLRGTGSSFATNIGGRMIGTMAAVINTELLAPLFSGENPQRVALAAAVIGTVVYAVALFTSFFLPPPRPEREE